MRTDFDQRWRELSDEVLSGMKEWRLQHPRATLREIEAALDERLGGLRARMLEEAALASAAAEWEEPATQMNHSDTPHARRGAKPLRPTVCSPIKPMPM